ncbi:D-2-hydroxyacid dehydrogenase [Ramlibacter sp.]|uniref:D-2-hydroxyacid dehydrogenase n=1 Tax=Ramlibacter sp. TaxID=1917967 RepID=UPI003D0BB4FC
MSTLLRVHFESLTDRAVFHITEARLAQLRAAHGEAFAGVQVSRGEDLAGIAGALADAQVLVTSEFVLSHPRFPLRDLATAAPHLRWIHVTNAGIEKLLPLDWLPPAVTLTNSRGAHAIKAREYATMTLLMLNTQLPRMAANQRQSKWEKVHTTAIAGKTLCVVGAGNLGEAFAHSARALGLRVIGVRRSGEARPEFDRMFTPDRLLEALREAEFVAACVPLTPETQGMFGEREFAAMKPDAGFVNVARGKVVDHDALRVALESGHLSGAVSDVFPVEPLPADSWIWGLPNFVMTPHVAMDDPENFLMRCMDIAAGNLVRMRKGEGLRNVVDPVRGY